MAATQTGNSAHIFTPLNPGGVVSFIEAIDTADEQAKTHRLLQLSNRLQSSLALEDVLSRFSHEIKQVVDHDGLLYIHGKQGIEFTLGKLSRNRMHYQLKLIDGEVLGSLTLCRKRRFTEEETCEVENLICALLYPLRNALLYRTALRAAHKDALTGTGNRAAFNEAVSREVELAQRHHRSLGMIVIDIDHFKHINDTYGHATGDCLIRALANTTENTIRLSDQLFRYGGEEFVVLLPEPTENGIKQLAERIRRNVESLECVCEGKHIKMTASFGVALLQAGENEDEFFIRADKALYEAKSSGRNCTRTAF